MTAVPNGDAPAMESGLAGAVDDVLITRLAGQARAQGVNLVGEGGLLQQLTKRALEAALEGELDAHLGSGDTNVRVARRVMPATAGGPPQPLAAREDRKRVWRQSRAR